MFEVFEKGTLASGYVLSIESNRGKEISDDALLMCNTKRYIFSQFVLGVRDMKMLWSKIIDIASKNWHNRGW
jgi:methanol---5-hydroxybenzimidazolylcobamide Co-methyltransferase